METFWRGWQAGSDGTEMPASQMCLPVGLCENCSLWWEEEVSDNFLFRGFGWIMVVYLVGWLSFLLSEALSTEKRDFFFFFFPESSCLLSRLWGVRATVIGSYCVGGSPSIMYGNRRRMKTGGGGQEAPGGGSGWTREVRQTENQADETER